MSQGIGLLAQYGVEGETADVRRAALRCVANALLLDSSMRQVFADTGYGGKLAERLKVPDTTLDSNYSGSSLTEYLKFRPIILKMRWSLAGFCSFRLTTATWILIS
jgi:hypothetical protein